jgi:hypothetical protein
VKYQVFFFIAFIFITLNSLSQDCNSVIESKYFSYPANSDDSSITIRSKDRLVEKDLKTGDSTIWKIKWTSKCSYTATYVSGNRKLTYDEREYLEKQKFAFEVELVTADYFIVSSYFNKVEGKPFARDTAFFTRKNYSINKILFEPVKNPAVLKKQKFSDTSQYAVVCIYRKGKLPCLLINGEIFFGGSLMALLPNKSAAIFKVKKEGRFEIESIGKGNSLKKDIDIQFGKKYYISFDPVLLKGCRFEIFIDEEALAKEEFESLL